MSYTTAEGRQQLLDTLAQAVDEIALALAGFGDAYEQVDEATGDRIEEQLFGPAQAAYGRAKKVHAAFAQRSGLPGRTFETRSAGVPSTGAHGFVDLAVEAAEEADAIIAELQDSMLPVEVGDPELRAGLSGVRELLSVLPGNADGLLRTLGR